MLKQINTKSAVLFSAIGSIKPWNGVFSAATMAAFLGANIVPKLERALQLIDINSYEQFVI